MTQQPKALPERAFSLQDAHAIAQILEGTTVQGLKGAAELAALINRFKAFVNAATGPTPKGKRGRK